MTTPPDTKAKPYLDVPSSPDFPQVEEEVLAYWKAENVFQASVDNRPASTEEGKNNAFIFYDGPPFANGLPHYGHLLTGYVKDLVARYQTMRGKRVERRFGWDCHGLPAELGAEKELGVSGRQQIMDFGIEKFNDACRESVMKYAREWEYYVTRQARWVDFENDYKTMDRDFMESVMWAFKRLYEKGLIYESHRVMPYSWAAQTPLSNFETRLDNAYRERTDRAVTVAFTLKERPPGAPEGCSSCKLLAWTTTPWTLPSNVALAVSPEMTYIPVVRDDVCHILGTSSLRAYSETLGLRERLETLRCTMRPFTKEDEGLLKSLHQHPEVAASTNDGMQSDEEVTADLDGFIKHQKEKGYSQWAVFHKETGAFMGRAGLSFRQLDPAAPPETEFRCALLPQFWGQGYATELGRAWMSIGLALHHVPKIVAGTRQRGSASHRMLEKLGFVITHDAQFRHEVGPYFELSREAWQKQYGIPGAVLVGQGYQPLFPYFADTPGAFRVLAGDFIEEGSGTGVVHMASGFGEDDQRVCAENGIPTVCPVDDAGCYTDELFDLAEPISLRLKGLNVIADMRKCEAEPYTEAQLGQFGLANLRIIHYLKQTGAFIRQEDYRHNYPHCWRTDTPLIYKAMPSWYVAVTKIRDQMAANNLTINWIPDHIQSGQMGRGIETAPDWSISRNRFWGAPIPIWRSDNPENDKLYVFGSIAELEEEFGVEVTDLHRPFIDELTKPDPKNPEYTLRRVSDVLDCWFESGSMPYAQNHFPFESGDDPQGKPPRGDFIVEYMAQTRGWFYTLQVLGAALFEEAPFKNCICHGVVLDSAGQKLSKRLQNYPDPKELFDTYGADALRWFMMRSPILRGEELLIDKDGKDVRETLRLVIKPIWNAYHFFTLYANADGVKAKIDTSSEDLLDRYILEKCRATAKAVREALDAYDIPAACKSVEDFFEVLNNWYIRRSRPRFWGSEMNADKQAAYNTLYTVFHRMCRVMAPLMPMISEAIFQGLTGEDYASAEKSVHLQDWPEEAAGADESWLINAMEKVRDACNAAHSIRNEQNIRIRQPLAEISIIGEELVPIMESVELQELIKDEANVKKVTSLPTVREYAGDKIKLNFPLLGKKYGPEVKIIKEATGRMSRHAWQEKNGYGDVWGGDRHANPAPAGTKITEAGWWMDSSGKMEVSPQGWIVDEQGNPQPIGETYHILPEEYEHLLEPKDPTTTKALPSQDALVMLDIGITEELAREGLARDLVRLVQETRKEAGLHISDRITLTLELEGAWQQAAEEWKSTIEQETLSTLRFGAVEGADFCNYVGVDDVKIRIGVTRHQSAAA